MAESPAKSVRLPADLWEFIDARAKALGTTRNAWLVRCVRDARKRLEATSAPAAKPALTDGRGRAATIPAPRRKITSRLKGEWKAP